MQSSKSNLASSGRRFSNGRFNTNSTGPEYQILFLGDGVVEPRQGDSTALYPNENAAITLPSSLFEQVNDSTISIFLGFYETAALFPINITHSSSTTRQTLVTSPVIAATVIPSLEDLLRATENITITFRLPNNTNMVCMLLANYE